MINDLLDLAKAEAGKLQYDMREVGIDTMILPILNEYEALAEQKGLQLAYRKADELDQWVMDSERIGQVVRNFLSNAFKFSPQGGQVVLRVAPAVDLQEQGDWLELIVQDQGPGIPEAELEQVFEKFVQSSTNKKGNGGTGLGLAICREIAHAHGGKVRAQNHRDGGAKFFLYLPMLDQKATDSTLTGT